ncbi:protein draper [Condylostylus longicornis]|uniref:protein draper n=1 Tax=Condylostylus longicornis TaxID=2530218 RepID=UPI00244DCBDA|nr:protein draper [Condylostylus longicornis]
MNFITKSLIFFAIICLTNFGNCEEISDLVDFSCKTTSDCSEFAKAFQNTTCINQECKCYNQNFEEVRCEPPPESFYNNIIGGGCPCTQQNSECNTKTQICYCEKGYQATQDKRRCIKKSVLLGEACEDDSQCIYQEKFSECSLKEKKCMCQKDFIEFNKGCISVVNLEEHCESNDQCNKKTNHSICALKKCACNTDYVANLEKTKCLPGVGHDGICSEDNQCKLVLGVGSICDSGLCSCDIKHKLLETKSKTDGKVHYTCEKEIRYGDYCYEHTDCYTFKDNSGEQSMECFHGECACRPDFTLKNGTFCVASGAHTIGNIQFASILIGISCLLISIFWKDSA